MFIFVDLGGPSKRGAMMLKHVGAGSADEKLARIITGAQSAVKEKMA